MKELWKDTAYNYIQISNYGNVRTKETVRPFLHYDRFKHILIETTRTVKSHLMKIQTNNKGYKFVCYKEFGKRKNLLVHRLVAEAFIPNPQKLTVEEQAIEEMEDIPV